MHCLATILVCIISYTPKYLPLRVVGGHPTSVGCYYIPILLSEIITGVPILLGVGDIRLLVVYIRRTPNLYWEDTHFYIGWCDGREWDGRRALSRGRGEARAVFSADWFY